MGVAGGATRSASVRNALAAARADEHVVVHDAARPLVTAAHFLGTLAALEHADAAIAAAPLTDTVKEAGADRLVTATLDRSRLWAVQTPQAFRRQALERALAVSDDVLAAATDDAWLVERTGGTVLVVESSPENLKVTTPHDLRVAELLLGASAAAHVDAGDISARRWRMVAVGATAGVLSGLLGVGGGIIIVPGLVWAAGISRHTATGTSLLAILPIAVVGALTYALAPGGAFDLEASAVLVAGSLVGAVLGTHINARVSRARCASAWRCSARCSAPGWWSRSASARARRRCRSTPPRSRCSSPSAWPAGSWRGCSAWGAA